MSVHARRDKRSQGTGSSCRGSAHPHRSRANIPKISPATNATRMLLFHPLLWRRNSFRDRCCPTAPPGGETPRLILSGGAGDVCVKICFPRLPFVFSSSLTQVSSSAHAIRAHTHTHRCESDSALRRVTISLISARN